MAYCNIGDKPTLNYQFVGQPEKVIKFSFAPIDVVVKVADDRDTGNYSPSGYGLSVVNTQTYQRSYFGVTDYYVENRGIPEGTFDYRFNFHLHGKKCGSSEYTPLEFIVPNSVLIDTAISCPVADVGAMMIQVKYANQIIFSEQHNTSVTFSVSCGECPEGFCKCPTPGYPGYCCLDCASTAASIRAITNELRNKNG